MSLWRLRSDSMITVTKFHSTENPTAPDSCYELVLCLCFDVHILHYLAVNPSIIISIIALLFSGTLFLIIYSTERFCTIKYLKTYFCSIFNSRQEVMFVVFSIYICQQVSSCCRCLWFKGDFLQTSFLTRLHMCSLG